MPDCPHTKVMFVPFESNPEAMAILCLQCQTIVGVHDPDDPETQKELEEIGESLGDPEGDEWDERFLWG